MKQPDPLKTPSQFLLSANHLPWWGKLVAMAASLLLYAAALPYLNQLLSRFGALLPAVIPAIIGVLLYGFWGGILSSLLSALLCFKLIQPLPEGAFQFLLNTGGTLGFAFLAFSAAVTGWLRDMLLGSRLEQQSLLRSEAKYRTIYRISAAAQSATNLDELFESIHAAICEVLRADNFYIALYDTGQDVLTFPYFRDEQDPPPEAKKLGRGLTEFVLRTGRPLLATPEVLAELKRKGLVEPSGTPSVDWVGVPLYIGGQPTGVMVLQSYSEQLRFSDEVLDFLIFVSEQVAMAIERKQAEEKLKYLSIHDALTGLYNRAYFEDEMIRLEGGRQFPVSLIMVDLNGLKSVNDQLGHPAGDDLLRRTAQVLRSAFRTEDGVARIGGDEFAVVLPRVEAQAAALAVQRIREAVRKHNEEHPELQISLSIGAATVDKGVPLMEAFREADRQMYLDKVHRSASSA